GKLAIVGVPMAMNQSCYGIESIDKKNQYFVYFLLKTVIDKLKANTHGSVFDTITRNTFESVNVSNATSGIKAAYELAVSPWMSKIKNNLKETGYLKTARDMLLPKLL